MAKGIDRELKKLAQEALREAFEGGEVKSMVRQEITAALEESHEAMRQALVEMVSLDNNAVGTCEICSAVVQAKYLKRLPTLEHARPSYSGRPDQWMFACSRCVKELEAKGGISRLIRHYDYVALPVVETAEKEEPQDVSQQ